MKLDTPSKFQLMLKANVKLVTPSKTPSPSKIEPMLESNVKLAWQNLQYVKRSLCHFILCKYLGWDISGMNLADAMGRARVLDYNLQQQLRPHMEDFIPRPSIYYPDFIAADQDDRADNIIDGGSKWDHLWRLRQDIRDFKIVSGVDKVHLYFKCKTCVINNVSET